MNHTQKKYAMARVDEIAHSKVRAIEKTMPTIPLKTLNYRKALKLIKDGKVKMVADANKVIDTYADFTDVFDFSPYHSFSRRGDQYDTKAFGKKVEVVRTECVRIKDQIMLGDAEEALKMILAFEKI